MSQSSVYIETTIVSYLAARLSRDLIVAAHQQLTRDWWDSHRERYRLVTSQIVFDEAAAGNPAYAAARLEALRNMEFLELTPEVESLSRELLQKGPLPANAEADAAHIALSIVHHVDYLLTWNCKHIANAEIQAALTRRAVRAGFKLPILCTPEQLMGGA
ncbi:MAG: type II toxin-antitoxin system VapC family toxin [Planctomycetaceae bacterium]